MSLISMKTVYEEAKIIEYHYLFRVLIAGICGLIIGYERKSRMKEAGIRTHFVVAIGASLMMVISKYGFQDIIGNSDIALDPSRIAAQVVSGVGFLGAGMIFMQRQTVKGLTTAAGIWATAGIGMAIAAGLYEVGIGVTILIVVAQMLLHSGNGWLSSPRSEQITIIMNNEPGSVDYIQELLHKKGVTVLHFHAEKRSETADLILNITVKLPVKYDMKQLLSLIQNANYIKMVELI